MNYAFATFATFSALTKSHTHGSFARPKMAEEGSEEWWASEKAKKLSPKRFDASEMQFKKVRFEVYRYPI